MSITNKALTVIESCENLIQLESAKKYKDLAIGINKTSAPVLTKAFVLKKKNLKIK